MAIYEGAFSCWSDVQTEFSMSDDESSKIVLLAAYDTGNYEGMATVIWFEKGRFWFVEGAHCSCYGLEGQWQPEEIPLKALIHRAEHGKFYCGDQKRLHELLLALADDLA